MSKGAGKQTVTNSLDPQTSAMQRQIFDQAQNVYNNYTPKIYPGQTVAPADGLSRVGTGVLQESLKPLQQIAQQNLGLGNQYSAMATNGANPSGPGGPDLGAYQHAGDVGAAALGGDPSAIGSLMNPYTANVIDQVKSQYGDLNGMAQR